MEALMPLGWFRRNGASTAIKTAAEIRADKEIHSKEVELTYLRQVVEMAKTVSSEAGADVAQALHVARTYGAAARVVGDRLDADFGGGGDRHRR